MGRRARAPWRLHSRDGWAWINFNWAGSRYRKPLGLRWDETSTPDEDKAVRDAAAARFVQIVAGLDNRSRAAARRSVVDDTGGQLSVSAYADLLGVKRSAIRAWAEIGMPAEWSIGGSVRWIDPAQADAWVADHRRESLAVFRRSVVYVAIRESARAVKFGWSDDVIRRLRELRRTIHGHVGLVAAVPGTRSNEATLHARFASVRVDGEWCTLTTDAAVAALVEVCLPVPKGAVT